MEDSRGAWLELLTAEQQAQMGAGTWNVQEPAEEWGQLPRPGMASASPGESDNQVSEPKSW